MRAAIDAGAAETIPVQPAARTQSRRAAILKKTAGETLPKVKAPAKVVAAPPLPAKTKKTKPARKPLWPVVTAMISAGRRRAQNAVKRQGRKILCFQNNLVVLWRRFQHSLGAFLLRFSSGIVTYGRRFQHGIITFWENFQDSLAVLWQRFQDGLVAFWRGFRQLVGSGVKPALRLAAYGAYAGLVSLSGTVLFTHLPDRASESRAIVFAEKVTIPAMPVWRKAEARPVPVASKPVPVKLPEPVISPSPAKTEVAKIMPPAAKIKQAPSARIAIVIDDLGMDRKNTRRAAELPAAVTLAFLPYAPDLKEQTAQARTGGHELIVHLPMEPKEASVDPGPLALMTGENKTQLLERLDWNLSRFTGFVGVNNHMGSRFTENSKDMRAVLRALQERGLYFLDSRTSPDTVGQDIAGEIGMAHAKRDVFLDNIRNPAAIRRQLTVVEHLAVRRGQVIAIGHPYPETMDVLHDWAKGLEASGIELVSLSELIKNKPKPQRVAAAAP